MKKRTRYEVSESEPWEPSYLRFVTYDKAFADWWCEEHNKCTDNGMTSYYVTEELVRHCTKPNYNLQFGFVFRLHTGELLWSSVDPHLPHEDRVDLDEELYRVNGKGHSYEGCLMDAKGKYNVHKLRCIFGLDNYCDPCTHKYGEVNKDDCVVECVKCHRWF